MNLPNQIETKRLVLRLFNKSDFNIFSDIMEDDDITNNLKFVLNIEPKKNNISFFQYILNSYSSEHPIFALIISIRQSGQFIGSCGLIPLKDKKGAQVFFTLLPKFRGFGYAIEAMKKIIEFAFKGLNLTKIWIYIDPTNSKAWRVAERIGMKYMGQKQMKSLSSEAMYFSMEKSEFEAQLLY